MTKADGQTSFEAYNAHGPNAGKTFDGRDVPPWSELALITQERWAAAETAAGRKRLDAFGLPPRGDMAEAFNRALIRYDRECIAHNCELTLRVLLECFEDELQKMRDGDGV